MDLGYGSDLHGSVALVEEFIGCVPPPKSQGFPILGSGASASRSEFLQSWLVFQRAEICRPSARLCELSVSLSTQSSGILSPSERWD